MAGLKISQLAVASAINNADIFPFVQSGVTKSVTRAIMNARLDGTFFKIEYDAAITDYRATIQDALDNYNTVVIGSDPSEVFPVRRAIYPNDNNVIIINGTLKQTDAIQDTLPVDVIIGSFTMTVNDGSVFEIGDYLAASDDNQPPVGGGAGHTRLMSISRKITNIAGNVITFADPAFVGLIAADNGNYGSANSVFIIDGKTNIRFCGIGRIDGNKANQYNHGFWNSVGGEEIFSCNGISVKNSTYIYLECIKIFDCNLHDITTWTTSYILANQLILESADNKNWLFYDASDAFIDNCISNLADYEDGFVLYYGNDRIHFNNCSAIDNGRMGFGINSTNINCSINNCYAEGNGMNLYIGLSERICVSNFHSKDGGNLRHSATIYRPIYIKDSEDIRISSLFVNGCEDNVNELILIAGECFDVVIDGGVAQNTIGISGNGIGFQQLASGGFTPERCSFDNFSFKTLKTGIALINDAVDRVIFKNCNWDSNTNDVAAIRDSAKFYDCRGIITRNAGILTFGAAVTQVYGVSNTEGRPVKERFRAWFLDDGGNATKIYCDYVNSNPPPANNFRLNLDVVPGVEIKVAWIYDHNINIP